MLPSFYTTKKYARICCFLLNYLHPSGILFKGELAITKITPTDDSSPEFEIWSLQHEIRRCCPCTLNYWSIFKHYFWFTCVDMQTSMDKFWYSFLNLLRGADKCLPPCKYSHFHYQQNGEMEQSKKSPNQCFSYSNFPGLFERLPNFKRK